MSIAMIEKFKYTGLPPTARFVGFLLADHHNEKTLRCDPSIQLLTEETGLSDRAVRNAIKRIAADGHLTVDPRPGGRNRYRLHPVTKCSPASDAGLNEVPDPPASGAGLPRQDVPDTPASDAAEPEGTGTTTRREPEHAAAAAGGRKKSKSGTVEEDQDFAAACAYEIDLTAEPILKTAWLEWQQYRQSRHTAKGQRRLQWTLQAARLSANAILSAAEQHGARIVQDRIAAAIAGEWKGLNLEKLEAGGGVNGHKPEGRVQW